MKRAKQSEPDRFMCPECGETYPGPGGCYGHVGHSHEWIATVPRNGRVRLRAEWRQEMLKEAIALAESSEWWRCPEDDSRWRERVIADARRDGESPTCPRCGASLEPCDARPSG